MGRPSKLTEVTARRICDLIRKGVPRDRAARLASVGVSTFHAWLAEGAKHETGKYRDFLDAVCMAEDELVAKAVSTVHDLLGPKRGRAEAVRLNAAKFVLSHRFNREFSTRQEVTGKDGAPVQVQASVTIRPLVTDQQLAELTPEQLTAVIAGLVPGGG